MADNSGILGSEDLKKLGTLTFLPQYQLLVCSTCKTALILSRVVKHLQQHHSHTKSSAEKAYNWACELPSPGVISTEPRLYELQLPSEVEPIRELGEPKLGGFRCTFTQDCTIVISSEKEIRKHLVEKHGWKSPFKQGKPPKNLPRSSLASGLYRSNVAYQRLFQSGPASRLFEVKRQPISSAGRVEELGQQRARPETAIGSSTAGPMFWELTKAFQAARGSIGELEANLAEETSWFTQPNNWVERLGAIHHLEAFGDKKGWLRGLLLLPANDLNQWQGGVGENAELRLISEVSKSFERLVKEAYNWARPHKVSRAALTELARKVESQEPKASKVIPKHKPASVEQYAVRYKQFLAYCIRTYKLGPTERPNYRLNGAQSTAFEAVVAKVDGFVQRFPTPLSRQAAEDDERVKAYYEAIDKELLMFLFSVLSHRLTSNEYDNVMVSFLAVAAIQPDNSWESPVTYTPKLSAIVTLSKLLLLLSIVRQRESRVQDLIEGGKSQEEAEEKAPSYYTLALQINKIFLMEAKERLSPYPLRWIILLRSFGLVIRNNTPSIGYIYWAGDVLHYKRAKLSLVNLLGSIDTALASCKEVLYKDLLFFQALQSTDVSLIAEAQLPPIPWDSIVDDVNNAAPSYSFIVDLLQDKQLDSQQWLLRRLAGTPAWTQQWVASSSPSRRPGTISPAMLAKYSRSIDRFLGSLGFLVHITYGQPARGTEFLTIRFRNTVAGGLRNVFINRGLVMLVYLYNKSDSAKVIYRFLPKSVSSLLVYYLWLVLPFWEEVRVYAGESILPSPFVWPLKPAKKELFAEKAPTKDPEKPKGLQKQWTSELLSAAVKSNFQKGCGQDIAIASWRHICKAYMRRYLLKIQPGKGASKNPLLKGILDDEDQYSSEDSDAESEEEGEPTSVFDRQTGHSGLTGANVYGRLVSEGSFEVLGKRESYRTASILWHRLLNLHGSSSSQPSSMATGGNVSIRPALGNLSTPTTARKRRALSSFEKQAQRTQVERLLDLKLANLLLSLQGLYGPTAGFRGLQEQALQAIMEGKNPVVVVMGTAAGKSLCFQLPAAISTGVTVVIAPLTSLINDLSTRSQGLRISASIWDPSKPAPSARLVFTTPESALSAAFARFLSTLRYSGQLDRIVVDECHTMLDGRAGYRLQLQDLGQLGQLGEQMVYLTATLPPHEVGDLFSLVKWDPSKATIIRGATIRPNICYSVLSILQRPKAKASAEDLMLQAIRAVVAEKLARFKLASSLVVIYCSTVKDTKNLAAALGCDAYYGDLDLESGLEGQKDKVLRMWDSTEVRPQRFCSGRAIVATGSALGLGLDKPNVRLVIHTGYIRSLKEYSQESGRAGRDGQPSEAIVLQLSPLSAAPRLQQLQPQPIQPVLREGQAPYTAQDYLSNRVCRRVVLDSYLDGAFTRQGCKDSEEKCDICTKSSLYISLGAGQGLRGEEVAGSGSLQSAASNIRPATPLSRPISSATSQLPIRASPSKPTAEVSAMISARERDKDLLSSRFAAATQQSAILSTKIREIHQELGEKGCSFCYMARAPRETHQQWDKCPNLGLWAREEALQSARTVEKRLERFFVRFSGCAQCYWPQALCFSWAEDGNGGWKRVGPWDCRVKGVIFGWFCLALKQEEKWEPFKAIIRQEKRIYGDRFDFGSIGWWFAQKRRLGDFETTNFVYFLALLQQQLEKDEFSLFEFE